VVRVGSSACPEAVAVAAEVEPLEAWRGAAVRGAAGWPVERAVEGAKVERTAGTAAMEARVVAAVSGQTCATWRCQHPTAVLRQWPRCTCRGQPCIAAASHRGRACPRR
jgi:hypothetical protein